MFGPLFIINCEEIQIKILWEFFKPNNKWKILVSFFVIALDLMINHNFYFLLGYFIIIWQNVTCNGYFYTVLSISEIVSFYATCYDSNKYNMNTLKIFSNIIAI